MTQLVWLRSDLRTQDHPALWTACQQDEPVIALFMLTPQQWREHGWGVRRIDWLLRNLTQCAAELAALGIPLHLLSMDDFSQAPDQLSEFCRQHQIRQVYWHQEYEWNERQRDQAVQARLTQEGLFCHALMDQVLFAPGTLLTTKGSHYTVFTPFYRQWLHHVEGVSLQPLPAPRPRHTPAPPAAPWPCLAEFAQTDLTSEHLPAAGEQAALAALDTFIEQGLTAYKQQRDYPAESGTSRLSPWLAVGALSPRQCLYAAWRYAGPACWDKRTGAGMWVSELVWREFYRDLLVGYPRLSRGRAFQIQTEAIAWRDVGQEKAARDFALWKAGRTGFPLVDAAMRQLNQTGWMHNRLRMLVAMFLTKQLLIDWRLGEAYFMQQLLDGDLASNNGGWQWAASTGVDAAPYFRLFNPESQAKKHDPQGRFIRRYIPELTERWGQYPPYPAACVDLRQARQRALQAFQAIKNQCESKG